MKAHLAIALLGAAVIRTAAAEDHAVAKDAMNGRFTVCGIPHQFKDGKIDWTFNPTYNGYREWPWQFARMYFLPALADYYRERGDVRAAQTFVDIVGGFIDSAPPPPPGTRHGDTHSWRTLDTGLRATSWVDSYFAFTNSPLLTTAFREKFGRSLEDHLVRLETPMTSNNWRIMELRGLVDITLAFPFVRRAAERRAAAERELEAILGKQLYPDGFQFELAPGYHTILDADYARLADRYRAFGQTPPAFLEKGIERAFEMYPHLVRPDRKLPDINDSDAFDLCRRMQVAARLFPWRADYRWFATGGREGTAPAYLSYAFPYAGAVVFRDSWSTNAVWGYVDMSPFGRGHQHEDKLNFLLFAYGKEMLCEGGLFDYDSSEMRRYTLLSRAHNTVCIDGKGQCARRTWKWRDEMLHQKADLTFETSATKDVAKATYAMGYGYEELGEPFDTSVTHTRTVEFVKDGAAPFFVVTDDLCASDDKEHSYEQVWHLETCRLDLRDTSFVADFGDGVTLSATFESANGRLTDQIARKEKNRWQGWKPIRPSGPHEHRPIHTPVLQGTFRGSAVITTVFRPQREASRR